jgi:hypothetical protein
MAVALTALVIALCGTAVAASSLVNGDSLIKKGTLSGDRLRKHTVTGTQVNLSKLGKVPSASKADTATNATSAGHARTAANATHATTAGHASSAGSATTAANAAALGGTPAAQFFRGAGNTRLDNTTVAGGGGLVTVATIQGFGTLSGSCNSTCTTVILSYTNSSADSQAIEFVVGGAAQPVVRLFPGASGGQAAFSGSSGLTSYSIYITDLTGAPHAASFASTIQWSDVPGTGDAKFFTVINELTG